LFGLEGISIFRTKFVLAGLRYFDEGYFSQKLLLQECATERYTQCGVSV